MILITATLVPGGDRSRSRLLGELVIANTGGTSTVGMYQGAVTKKPSPAHPGPTIWKRGIVTGFRRKRYGVWYLLYLMLVSMGFDSPDAVAIPRPVPATITPPAAPASKLAGSGSKKTQQRRAQRMYARTRRNKFQP